MGIDDLRTLGIPGLLHIVPIGSSTTLYRARQLSKDRMVALRLLDWYSKAEGRQRSHLVLRALQILSQHPHTVTVYGSGEIANGPTYLLLELLEEGSLGEWVAADGRLPCAEVLEVAVKVGGALETAHRAGVVHGCLGPESILVSPSGEPQLAGLERAVLRHVHARMDTTALPSIDDDLTALAVTMFTLLTATEPAEGRVKNALERCAVPAPVRGLIERCLASDHAFRPASIQDLTTAIQQVQQVLGLAMTAAIVDEHAAEEVAQALHKATALAPAKLEPASSGPKSEPEGTELESGPELEAAEPELELEAVSPEPESELTRFEPEPEPKSWPALVMPARAARRHWRRIVTVAALMFLTAVGTLAGVQLLRSQRAPQSAVDQPPAVVVEQPASNRDAVYTGFRTVADKSEQLSMIVPEEWSAIQSSPWTVNGKDVGSRLEASLAGSAGEPWSRPGAVLAVSKTLGTARTVDQVLDQLRIEPRACTYVGRKPFNDNLYAGAIDAYTGCGQADARVEILIATSQQPPHLVMVQVTSLGPRDERARDRVMETFQVSG
jgi:serine/threonine-protein kinase PknK